MRYLLPARVPSNIVVWLSAILVDTGSINGEDTVSTWPLNPEARVPLTEIPIASPRAEWRAAFDAANGHQLAVLGGMND